MNDLTCRDREPNVVAIIMIVPFHTDYYATWNGRRLLLRMIRCDGRNP